MKKEETNEPNPIKTSEEKLADILFEHLYKPSVLLVKYKKEWKDIKKKLKKQ